MSAPRNIVPRIVLHTVKGKRPSHHRRDDALRRKERRKSHRGHQDHRKDCGACLTRGKIMSCSSPPHAEGDQQNKRCDCSSQHTGAGHGEDQILCRRRKECRLRKKTRGPLRKAPALQRSPFLQKPRERSRLHHGEVLRRDSHRVELHRKPDVDESEEIPPEQAPDHRHHKLQHNAIGKIREEPSSLLPGDKPQI